MKFFDDYETDNKIFGIKLLKHIFDIVTNYEKDLIIYENLLFNYLILKNIYHINENRNLYIIFIMYNTAINNKFFYIYNGSLSLLILSKRIVF